jgi:hypothetical protein
MLDNIAAYPAEPGCVFTGDILAARGKDMAPEVMPISTGDSLALQLQRYVAIGELVRKQVFGRVGGQRHTLNRNWGKLIERKFGEGEKDEEKRAHAEKAAALNELAESRFSIFAGPAGAGKTTVLGILCAQPEIKTDGPLLLAPTGKARVRMQELAGSNSGRALTEDMLGALLDALQGVKRLILVGDPAQLPPIGAGRPFVDIIAKLRPCDCESRFPRVAPGYVELTVERRAIGVNRPDVQLARWFGSASPSPVEDDVFAASLEEDVHIRLVEWKEPEDFQRKLIEALVDKLKRSGPEDIHGFNRGLCTCSNNEYDYFNATRDGRSGAVEGVDACES